MSIQRDYSLYTLSCLIYHHKSPYMLALTTLTPAVYLHEFILSFVDLQQTVTCFYDFDIEGTSSI